MMLKTLRKLRANQNGQIAVEFALTLPTLIMGFLIIFDVGRTVYTYSSLMSAAADGARMASIHGARSRDPASDETILTFTKSRAIGINPANVTATVNWNPNSFSGSEVTLTLSTDISFFITRLLPIEPITLTRSSVMTVL